MPDWFDFVDQADSITYKQLGNGVNVGAVYNVIRAQVIRDLDLLGEESALVKSILGAPSNPDLVLGAHSKFHDLAREQAEKDEEQFLPLRIVK